MPGARHRAETSACKTSPDTCELQLIVLLVSDDTQALREVDLTGATPWGRWVQVWNSHLNSKGRLGLQVPPTGSKLRPLALMRSEQDLKGHLPAEQASSWSNKAFKVPIPGDTELPACGQGHTQHTHSHACAGSHIHSSPAKR